MILNNFLEMIFLHLKMDDSGDGEPVLQFSQVFEGEEDILRGLTHFMKMVEDDKNWRMTQWSNKWVSDKRRGSRLTLGSMPSRIQPERASKKRKAVDIVMAIPENVNKRTKTPTRLEQTPKTLAKSAQKLRRWRVTR